MENNIVWVYPNQKAIYNRGKGSVTYPTCRWHGVTPTGTKVIIHGYSIREIRNVFKRMFPQLSFIISNRPTERKQDE